MGVIVPEVLDDFPGETAVSDFMEESRFASRTTRNNNGATNTYVDICGHDLYFFWGAVNGGRYQSFSAKCLQITLTWDEKKPKHDHSIFHSWIPDFDTEYGPVVCDRFSLVFGWILCVFSVRSHFVYVLMNLSKSYVLW